MTARLDANLDMKAQAMTMVKLKYNLPWFEAGRAASQCLEERPHWTWEQFRNWVRDDDADYVGSQLVPALLSSTAELDALRDRLLGEGGLDIANRRYRLRIYRTCFVGSEAVQWLMTHENLTRAESLRVGQRLVRRDIIRHVLNEQDFADEFFFYVFV